MAQSGQEHQLSWWRIQRRCSGSWPRRCSAAPGPSAGLSRPPRRRPGGGPPASPPETTAEAACQRLVVASKQIFFCQRTEQAALVINNLVAAALLRSLAGEVAAPEQLVLLPDGLAPLHLLVLPRPQRLGHLCAEHEKKNRLRSPRRQLNRDARNQERASRRSSQGTYLAR
jgi:hypothetical protein